jgi:hypothetical protein
MFVQSLANHTRPSPAGLTMQVECTRLAQMEMPNSGIPEFGGFIPFAITFAKRDGLPGQARQ